MTNMIDIKVRVGPGDGIICRSGDTTLFVPVATDQVASLVDVFRDATPESVWDDIADFVVQLDFGSPAFALVAVSAERTRLRVFGDIEVTSDLATVPMLSGRGSRTWVDHATASPERFSIVSGAAANTLTDLADGTVIGGGLLIEVAPTKSIESEAPKRSGESCCLTLVPEAVSTLRSTLPLFGLRFDDGVVTPVNSPLVLGRKPLIDDVREVAVPVSGDRVSRTHLRVEQADGGVIVRDLGSHNGSAVIWASSGDTEELVAGEPVVVAVGDRVFIGSEAFTVERLDE